MSAIQKKKLPATLENLSNFMVYVSAFAGDQGFPQTRIREIEVALEEALVNVFNYAYPEKTGEVEVSCEMDNHSNLVIKIIDSGIPFDSKALADPDVTAHISERQIGGLGIYLMKKMIDKVEYRREGDKNVLTFTVHQP